MATTADLTRQLDRLEERVTNNIKFFWVVVGAGFFWMGFISLTLFNMNGAIGRLEKTQANAATNIVSTLLKRPTSTRAEAAANLGAVTTILRGSTVGRTKPDPSVIKSVSSELAQAQNKFPDLPEVWQATGQFINYKSVALLPQSAEKAVNSARSMSCDRITTGPEAIVLTGCTLDLENAVDSKAPVIFINCFVRYRGGLIKSKHMEFHNCVFQFDVLNVPPQAAMLAMMQLTTENVADVKISLS